MNKNHTMTEPTKGAGMVAIITVALIALLSLVFAFDSDARNLPPVLLALCLFVSVGAIVAAVACFVSLYQEDITQERERVRRVASIKRAYNDNEYNATRGY